MAHASLLGGANLYAQTLNYSNTPGNSNAGTANLYAVTALTAGGTVANSVATLINSTYSDFHADVTNEPSDGNITITSHTILDGDSPALAGEYAGQVVGSIAATCSSAQNYVWIQMITTNDPLPGQFSPSIDGTFDGSFNVSPYYPNQGSNSMRDDSSRDKPADPTDTTPVPVTFKADTFLAQIGSTTNGITELTIFDGFEWGYSLTPLEIKSGGGANSVGGGITPEVQAAPEPQTLLIFIPSALFVVRSRRRSWFSLQ